MSEPQTDPGRHLYALLPEVWRSRDDGDLSALLDGFGDLLTLVRSTLEQRLSEGQKWSRRQWAESRLAERFGKRVPAEVISTITHCRNTWSTATTDPGTQSRPVATSRPGAWSTSAGS